jgi:hypothetical protein
MESGHHDFCGWAFLEWVLTNWNAATVIDHSDAAVLVDEDRDFLAEAGYGLIYRVIHDFVNEMMQAIGSSSPDVHRRSLSNRVEAFEHLDRTRVIAHSRPILG